MINRKRLDDIQYLVLDQFNLLEMDMLINISKLLNANKDINTSNVDAWHKEMILKNKQLSKEQKKVIKKYQKIIKEEITTMYQTIGFETLEHDEAIYKKAIQQGLLSPNASNFKDNNQIIKLLKTAIKTANTANNLINTKALESSNKKFLQIVNKVQLEVVTGVRDYKSAVRIGVRNLAKEGITGQTYKTETGKVFRRSIESAVRAEIVSPTVNMTGKMQLERMDELGGNYVEVSSHIGARPDHAKWQGRVYMVKGANQHYKNLTTATKYGQVDGLQGANCKHFFYPFIPKVSERTYKPYGEKENLAKYKESQTQRRLERRIRDNKRQMVLFDQIGDKEAFNRQAIKLKKHRDDLNALKTVTGRTQQSRLFVGGFDVKLSNKANAVAQKNN